MSKRLDWDGAAKREAAQVPRPRPAPIAWWLTFSNGGRCSECSERIPKNTLIAYNHAEGRALCTVCVDRLGVVAQPSKRLLAQRQFEL